MTASALPHSSPSQRALALRFIWQSAWPYAVICCVICLVLAETLLQALPVAATFPSALFALIAQVAVPLSAVAQARSQLAAMQSAGIALSAEMLSPSAAQAFTSPLDPIATFELCADRLSSVGMGAALGFGGPAAFRHDPFKGEMTIGRVRPFWCDGAIRVTVGQHDSGPPRVHVRRLPGLFRFLPKLGAGLAIVQQVCTELERTLNTRRAALDAAVRAQDAERAALQAQLHLLQAQVEPHFLYNTLANLKHLIRTDAERAQTMVDHLVGYLQAALPDMRSESTTVQRELALAGHYLHLMQIRMGARLHYAIDADPAIGNCAMPPAMLVSLLENAVKHGLEVATRPGTITVTGRRVGRCVELAVRDDGAGLDSAQAGAGLGLANIHQRLQLLYGADAALRVAPGASGGVVATLRLPLREAA